MAYIRTTWVESETPLSAQNMNNIEDGIEELQEQKVDKVSGKALSDNNYTTAEKTKLAGIAANAEVNVQSDWSQSDSSADDFIKNKPVNATSSVAGFMSASDKSKLDGVQAGAQVNRTYTAVTGKPTAAASPGFGGTVTVSQVAQSTTGQVSVTDRVITIPSSDATTSAHGLMTAADKSKLNGIAAGAEVNQNAFSNVKVGSTTIAADGKTDTLTLEAGTNVTLTPDSSNDKVTITATDTTYSSKAAASGGTAVSLCTTGEKYTWNSKAGTAVATTSANGLMASADKTKLNGIAAGAEVNQNAFSNVKVGSTTVAADSKTDTLTLVAGANVTLTADATNDKVTIAATDTKYTAGTGISISNGVISVSYSNAALVEF